MRPVWGREEKDNGSSGSGCLPLVVCCVVIKYDSRQVATYKKNMRQKLCLKRLDTFGTETKVHRFTNNLQGLQKIMLKDFS